MPSNHKKKPFAHQKTRYFYNKSEAKESISSDAVIASNNTTKSKKAPAVFLEPSSSGDFYRYISTDILFSVILGAIMIGVLLLFYYYGENLSFFQNIVQFILSG